MNGEVAFRILLIVLAFVVTAGGGVAIARQGKFFPGLFIMIIGFVAIFVAIMFLIYGIIPAESAAPSTTTIRFG